LEKHTAFTFKDKEEANHITSKKEAELIPDYMASHPI
jgi:hypothetical protein